MSDPESLIVFPCDFPIKVMGLRQHGFAQAILEVVKQHSPDYDASSVEMRSSREGKYLSLTITVKATSQQQLDDLYRDLCDHSMVSMVL
jgi:uncharacterized protein